MKPKVEVLKTISVKKTVTLEMEQLEEVLRKAFKVPKSATFSWNTGGYDFFEDVTIEWEGTETLKEFE